MNEKVRYLRKWLDRILLGMSLLCSVVILFHLGYNSDPGIEKLTNRILEWCFLFFAVALAAKTFTAFQSNSSVIARIGEAVLLFYFVAVIVADSYHFSAKDGTELVKPEWMYIGIFAIFIIEISKQTLFFDQFYFNPTLLFVLSFLLLILIGTALLLLPKSTYDGQLNFIDALFLATSAVCITGLSVVDIAAEFTGFGQTVLLVLVQIGGLGIMTFTGFFGYFFSGGFSYKNQLMFTELIGENKVSSVISTLYKIILVTFSFEIAGGILIYLSLDADDFSSSGDRLYFTVFHAVTAFCNAGFSNLSNGLNDAALRFNYPLQLSVILLYVMGGLGFGIVFNTYEWTRRWIFNVYHKLRFGKQYMYRAGMISFNSKIIAYTTFFLIIFGFLAVLILERHHTLREHESYFGKIVTALFIGTSPRSAGFNTVIMSELAFPTVMLILLLMWIGAAPGSTGGGIKVTTFALATLNIFSITKGKDRIEVFGRNVSDDSISRAFAIISLSLIFLGAAVFTLAVTDPEKTLLSLAFETFSAYSTTGLSLGVTPNLSQAGRLVIIVTMFVGRVGSLTLLIALVRNAKPKDYRLPTEQMNF
ncbi:TrkH family potassium uptake protein [Dyadobacter psychrophilus]|uniref:Trk-type K+ transport system, membrane component n=1 Tax=Dyadobacter psychrophilus TaxID=651661 RepID=A0A1T5BTD2_9BACT|nr:potassium transporter TrkG [Dyadobacter psychrophilus]SKB50582.1 Trk-type K+ transport system, membrane component [Dyadobacter psychrophilus]